MKLNVVCIFENSENTIKECVESIKNQYFTDFNVTLIDNNSSDSSYEIVSKIVKNDKRFKIVKNQVKKFYASNIIENFSKLKKISWSDIIIEINSDEKFVDNNVFGLVTKIFNNENNWVLIDSENKNNLINLRSNIESGLNEIKKLKIFKSFLLWSAKINQNTISKTEKFNNKSLSYALPILEMSDANHIIPYPNLFVKILNSQKNDLSNNINELKQVVGEILHHDRINLIQNTIFKSSSIYENQNTLVNFDIKKKSLLPNIKDQNLKMKVEESKSEPILEPKLDLKKIVPPQKLSELFDNKTTKTKEITIDTIIEKTEINTIKKVNSTSPPDQKNIIIQKVLEKRKPSIQQPQNKKEEKKEIKKLNQVNYNGLNSILDKKPNIKINKRTDDLKKNINQRNEIFEIKQRQVHREIKLPKPNLSETKPKANIKIR